MTSTSASFEPLSCARDDVMGLTVALESHGDGTPNFEVRPMIVDESETWQVGDLLSAIDLELEDAKHFLFYFSGHGHVTQFGLELVTPEKEHNLDSGIYFDVLLHRFNTAPADTEITVILDCCFSGEAGDTARAANEALQHRFTTLREGITILASSGRTEESRADAEGPSDFTGAVIERLNADVKRTTILDVYSWAKEQVPAQTPVLRTFGSRHSALRAADRATANEDMV
ncbi:caspase family protein [Microbacterium esteraromaticum]|uniref:caspase family protein n=1 Tax=Microbacterium esteraromaticum TaxID=57043 RepID=UPI00358FC0BC